MEPNQNNQNNPNNQPSQNTTPPNVINASADNYHNPASNPSTNMDSNPTPQNPPKKSHSALYGMIFFAILAAAGIGFGIWAMLDGNSKAEKKEAQISDLQSQLSEAMQANPVEDTAIVEDTETITETITEDSTATTPTVNTADYIYVGEWNLKIQVPSNLTLTGYKYYMSTDGNSLGVWGTAKGGQYFPDFANTTVNTSPMGIISQYPKGAEKSPLSSPKLVFSDDQYDYYYSHPQIVYSQNGSEREWETESSSIIEQMFNNANNYSKI